MPIHPPSELSMPMFQDRRVSPRQIVNCPGSIVSEAGAASQDCLIADISDGGVRLFVQSKVADEFVLVIKDGSDANHACRVVWRLDDELGAEFI
jgi:PilZ domain.